jgi:tetratricopeptide (TPR) repeat protein
MEYKKRLATVIPSVFYPNHTLNPLIFSMFKQLVSSILPLLILAQNIYGQNPAEMPMRQVMSEAQELIGAGDYATAAPYLDQLEIRFAGEGNPEVEKILEQFGFVRGVGYVQNFGKTGDMSNMQKAADAFAKFVEKYPENANAVSAMQQRTTCLRALQKWDEAAEVIEELLDEDKPFKKKILKRSELMNLYYGRAQCYHIKQNWRMGENAFNELLKFADLAKDEDRAAYAVSCMVEMFVQEKRVDEIFPLLPRLSGDTPARFDLRLNVNLMQGAELLKEKDRHVEASLLFALTMTTEEIVTFYTAREKQISLDIEQIQSFIDAQGRRLPAQRVTSLKNRINDLAMKATSARSHLKLAKDTPSFTTVLRWRKADNFQACMREWESFWAFYWLYKDFPNHEMVENFIYAAFASANKVKYREKSIELGEEYLANKELIKFRPDVTFIMANAYRKEAVTQMSIVEQLQSSLATVDKEKAAAAKAKADEYQSRFFELCDDFLEVMPEHKYSREFIGMMGAEFFKRQEFDKLLRKFAGYENGSFNPSAGYANKKELQGTDAMGRINYMSGLAFLASGNYDAAKPFLGAVVGVSVDGLPLDEAAVSEN